MEQFEKVCKGLEELRNFADTDVHPVVSPDNWDVYSDLCDLIDEFGTDALALIRQQQARIAELEEAQKPIPPVVEQEMDEVCSCIDDVYYCGKCRCRLYRFAEKNKYCSNCGKAVKWNATD